MGTFPEPGWYSQHTGMSFARLILLTDSVKGGRTAALVVERVNGALRLHLEGATPKQARHMCRNPRLADGPPPMWQGLPTEAVVAEALQRFALLPV